MSAPLTKYFARSSCVSFSMTISDLLALIELPTFTLKSSTIIFSENKSANFSLLALQGPNSKRLLEKLTDADLDSLEYYSFLID